MNEFLFKREDLSDLIGKNSPEVMENNHENHANFMDSMFRLKSSGTFVKTVLWVYRTYISRGFSPDYFPVELKGWKNAAASRISGDPADIICSFYDLMIKHHKDFLALYPKSSKITLKEEFSCYFNTYVEAIVSGNSAKALNVARKYIKDSSHIPPYWLYVLEPAMYKIGDLWASGEITVGQEHLATSITQRVMSVFYPVILDVPKDKEAVLIVTSRGELHEVGARMVADLLELEGWNVYYMGANTPKDSIISFLKENRVTFLGISTTMIYNIGFVQSLIKKVREEISEFPVHIIVGGQVYLNDAVLWKKVGADGFCINAEDAINYFKRLEVKS